MTRATPRLHAGEVAYAKRQFTDEMAQARPVRGPPTLIETWAFNEGEGALPVRAEAAVEELGRRIADGKLESWLHSSAGRHLAVMTNTERAMVILLNEEGNPGAHASDPGADDWSDGFILENGQNDEYPGEDTVLLGEAFRIVRHIIVHGTPPSDATWTADR